MMFYIGKTGPFSNNSLPKAPPPPQSGLDLVNLTTLGGSFLKCGFIRNAHEIFQNVQQALTICLAVLCTHLYLLSMKER